MPSIGFICPDKERVLFEECFKGCRLSDTLPCGRCKALPYLRKCSQQRGWTGEPSTTQLIRGVRESWLKITRPYYVNPDDRAFALLGTQVHGVLDQFGKGDHFSEERLRDEICSGAFDFYDGESQNLFDYKTWGSYKIQRALGITSIEVPVTDEYGHPILKKSGKNKGEPKTKKEYTTGDLVTRAFALYETSIQMSDYREKLLTILPEGYSVKGMAVQAVSRDGGLMVSVMRGIEEKAPLIPVNGISWRWIKRYMHLKKEMLLDTLDKDYAPPWRPRETWNGKKCEAYCEVSEACKEIW